MPESLSVLLSVLGSARVHSNAFAQPVEPLKNAHRGVRVLACAVGTDTSQVVLQAFSANENIAVPETDNRAQALADAFNNYHCKLVDIQGGEDD